MNIKLQKEPGAPGTGQGEPFAEVADNHGAGNGYYVLDGLNTLSNRDELYEELHARPIPRIKPPMTVSHLAVLTPVDQPYSAALHLAQLAQQHSANPPARDATHFEASFDNFELRWEKHNEFSTYTFLRKGYGAGYFSTTALQLVPHQWLASMPGKVVASVQAVICDQELPEPGSEELSNAFDNLQVFGGRMVDDRAVVWASLRLDHAGFTRLLISDRGLSDYQMGRSLQRLLEFETYRIMALLALPTARRLFPRVNDADQELARIMREFTARAVNEQKLFDDLSHLAAELERMRADSDYRFSATRAYHELSRRRLADLREQGFPGRPTIHSLMERRLVPAMRTCESVQKRIEALSARIARAGVLMRTRVEISTEAQNSRFLQAMSQRLALQLKMQQTVEGLSVAAISYYSVGLLHKLVEMLPLDRLPLRKEVITGLLVVPVVLVVWALIRRLTRHVTQSTESLRDPG